MSDQTEVKGLDNAERQANKGIYAGKQLYRLACEMKAAVHSARQQEVPDEDLGIFAELDIDKLVEAARALGNVPIWNAETTPVGKKLTYPQGTTGLNQ